MHDRPRHIALFLPALNSGGAESALIALGNYWAEQGHRIDILVVKDEGAYRDRLSANLNLVELGGKGMLRALSPLLGYMRRHKPEWIIAALPGPNLIAIIAGLLARSVMTSRPGIAISQHHPFSEKVRKAAKLRSHIRHILARYLYPLADRIIAVSYGVADDLAHHTQLKRERITVIHNPFDISAIRQKAGEAPNHDWLHNHDMPVLVAAGRLEAPKDFPALLRALAECDNHRLIILGEGPDLDELQQLARDLGIDDRVDFTGFVANPYGFFAHADCFVLSSHYEGFGNVVVEALATGTPVIATDCPHGPREILDYGRYGQLVPPGDPGTLAQAIKQCEKGDNDDHTTRHERAQAFDITGIAVRYLDCCSSLPEANPAKRAQKRSRTG
jgi:glycosyltransferase involved in cell wall biosynthesis